jgi:predicted patatin/cPLA2 family phospholipase
MAERDHYRRILSSRDFVLVYVALALLLLQGCATLRPRNPLPEDLESKVQIPGMPGVRTWGDEVSETFTKFAQESVQQERAAYGKDFMKRPASFLALSGGGDDGAFGAGVLCGWTAHGDRPEFKLVTGISTGALIAPFAFLGSGYDDTLRYLYTGITGKDIFYMKSLLTVLWRESVADTKPLAKMLDKYIDATMLADIAAAHARGRRLIIGTTQLDAQRLVLWDMGAIAASGDPDALKLFRKIMLTSASIPGAFPPQFIKVEAAGKFYEEMHVDGGTTAEVVLYESALKPLTEIFEKELLQGRPRFLYIIRNSAIKPEWESVKPRVGPIAARAIATLIKTQGIGDLYRLYSFAKRDKMDYNLAAIPEDLAPAHPKEQFNQNYMNQLFDLGYEMASQGYPWLKYPPGFNPNPVFKKPVKTAVSPVEKEARL